MKNTGRLEAWVREKGEEGKWIEKEKRSKEMKSSLTKFLFLGGGQRPMT